MTTSRRNNPMAPYFVQMREFERKLIRAAIAEAEGKMKLAAQMLGVTRHYLHARARLLGGVVGDEPKHEPPGSSAKAWSDTNNVERKPRASEANGA